MLISASDFLLKALETKMEPKSRIANNLVIWSGYGYGIC